MSTIKENYQQEEEDEESDEEMALPVKKNNTKK